MKNFLKKIPSYHSVIILDKQKIRYFDKYIPERIILISDNPETWHQENYKMNKKHYPWGVRYTTYKLANFIQRKAAKMFYNNVSLDIKKNDLLKDGSDHLQPSPPENMSDNNNNDKINNYQTHKNFLVRYGVISKSDFLDDLENWTYLKISSYLHMPNNFILDKSNEFKEALFKNYMQAVTL